MVAEMGDQAGVVSGGLSPNIILMKVEVPPGKQSEERPQNVVIGGYASHSWRTNGKKGDQSCFLFNLTQNLRFQTRADA